MLTTREVITRLLSARGDGSCDEHVSVYYPSIQSSLKPIFQVVRYTPNFSNIAIAITH